MRVKLLYISIDAYLEAFKDRDHTALFTMVSNPLPADVKCVRVGFDQFGLLLATLESKSWPDVPEGETIPLLPAPIAYLHKYLATEEELRSLTIEARRAANGMGQTAKAPPSHTTDAIPYALR